MDWFKKHCKGTEEIFNIAYELQGIAKAFHAVGNDVMAERLHLISKELFIAQEMIRDAVGESISEDIKRTGENSLLILEAALAGITLEKGAISGKESHH